MTTDAIETTDPITTPAGTFRVSFYRDEDAMSPRDADSVGRLTISHRDVVDVDPDPVVDYVLDEVQGGRISTRAACRYLRHALDARVVLPVHLFQSWANEYSTGDPIDDGMRVHGFTYDTPEGRALLGDTPTDDEITRALVAEVADYSRWAAGEYVGYVIERLTDPLGEADPDDDDAEWTHTDSLWSIDSMDYAREESTATIERYRPEDFPSPVMAVQV